MNAPFPRTSPCSLANPQLMATVNNASLTERRIVSRVFLEFGFNVPGTTLQSITVKVNGAVLLHSWVGLCKQSLFCPTSRNPIGPGVVYPTIVLLSRENLRQRKQHRDD